MKQWFKENCIMILIFIAIGVFAFFVTSCKSFAPKNYVIEGQSEECNDFYIVMGYYSIVEKSDSAFVGTVYTECKTTRADKRKAEREKHCKQLFYGEANLDKTKYEQYSAYLECSK